MQLNIDLVWTLYGSPDLLQISNCHTDLNIFYMWVVYVHAWTQTYNNIWMVCKLVINLVLQNMCAWPILKVHIYSEICF